MATTPKRRDSSSSDEDNVRSHCSDLKEFHNQEGCFYKIFPRKLKGRLVYVWLRKCVCKQYNTHDITKGPTNIQPEDGKEIHFSPECQWKKPKKKNDCWIIVRKCPKECTSKLEQSNVGNATLTNALETETMNSWRTRSKFTSIWDIEGESQQETAVGNCGETAQDQLNIGNMKLTDSLELGSIHGQKGKRSFALRENDVGGQQKKETSEKYDQKTCTYPRGLAYIGNMAATNNLEPEIMHKEKTPKWNDDIGKQTKKTVESYYGERASPQGLSYIGNTSNTCNP